MLRLSASQKQAGCNLHAHLHKPPSSLIDEFRQRRTGSAQVLFACGPVIQDHPHTETRAILQCSAACLQTVFPTGLVGCLHNLIGGVQGHVSLTCMSSSFPLPACNSAAAFAYGLREGLACIGLEKARGEGSISLAMGKP